MDTRVTSYPNERRLLNRNEKLLSNRRPLS